MLCAGCADDAPPAPVVYTPILVEMDYNRNFLSGSVSRAVDEWQIKTLVDPNTIPLGSRTPLPDTTCYQLIWRRNLTNPWEASATKYLGGAPGDMSYSLDITGTVYPLDNLPFKIGSSNYGNYEWKQLPARTGIVMFPPLHQPRLYLLSTDYFDEAAKNLNVAGITHPDTLWKRMATGNGLVFGLTNYWENFGDHYCKFDPWNPATVIFLGTIEKLARAMDQVAPKSDGTRWDRFFLTVSTLGHEFAHALGADDDPMTASWVSGPVDCHSALDPARQVCDCAMVTAYEIGKMITYPQDPVNPGIHLSQFEKGFCICDRHRKQMCTGDQLHDTYIKWASSLPYVNASSYR